MKTNVDRFKGLYSFLSNFFDNPIEFEGILYPTNEHAFQAVKDLNPEIRSRVAAIESTYNAKLAGRGKYDLRTPEEVKADPNGKPILVTLREDWDQVKDEVMYQINMTKFRNNPSLKAALLGTLDAELIEGNHWGDVYWGVCGGVGQNKLGKILMRIRSELKPV